MTKSKSIFILCLAILIVIFSGCSKQENKSMSQLQTNTTVADEVEITTEEKKETETATEKKSNSKSTTVKSESTTQKSDDSKTTKPAEQKSASQGTTKKVTTTQKSTTTERQTTTKKVTTTQKPTTTTEKAFDVSYWISYAKDYARSVGLEVNSAASDCWDNPISANSKCKYLERDIKGMLNRYAKDEDVTQVWIWAEKTSADSYNIYIGYA